MSVIHSSRARAVVVVAIALALALVIVALVQHDDVNAITGDAGPAHVTVDPTTALTDGQLVGVSATFAAGSVSEMRVHLCKHDAGISDTGSFDLDGPNCSPFKVSPAADAEKTVAVDPSATSANLAAVGGGFHVGIGTGATWTDFLGGTNTLTCDATHQCDLVVQFQIVGGQSWFTAPLTFAGGAPDTTTTTSSGTTTTTTTSPVTTTTTSPVTTTTTSPVTTTTTSPVTTTTTSPGTTTTTSPGTTTTTGPSSATTTTFPVVVGSGGAGTGTGGTGIPTSTGTGGLALTGTPSRDLASVALLLMAAGLLVLSLTNRRRAADR